jgi:hypothetical protein
VHYVPHGVDYDHFASALAAGPLPDDLAAIPEPRVGFFGLIHEWVDVELIGKLADVLPYSFVVIGSAKTDMTPVEGKPNVFVLGAGHTPSCRRTAAAFMPPSFRSR